MGWPVNQFLDDTGDEESPQWLSSCTDRALDFRGDIVSSGEVWAIMR